MKAEFTISRNELKALLPCISKDESRYILCGINCKVTKERVILIATDGRRLGFVSSETASPESIVLEDGADHASFIIPGDFLKKIPKAKKSQEWVQVKYENGQIAIKLPFEQITYEGKAIEGNYPNFWQVFPKPPYVPAVKIAGLKATFIKDAAEVAKSLGCSEYDYVRFFQSEGFNGADDESPVYLIDTKAKSLIYIVMPLKEWPHERFDVPNWIGKVLKEEDERLAVKAAKELEALSRVPQTAPAPEVAAK